jgi:hypothetical protein
MPIEFRYDSTKKIIRGKITSPFTAADLQVALQRMVDASKDFASDVPTLWDLRGIDFTKIDAVLMQQLNSIRKQFPQRGNACLALIAPTDLGYGMCRMYELMSADMPQKIMVFRSVEEGERWLLSECDGRQGVSHQDT